MKKKIKISVNNGKVQHLSEVLPLIPTNTILCKTLTGIGATYGEIRSVRNSIIIEPNRPVIYGKCRAPKHKNDNLFGVYEGIYTQDIVNYIIKSQDRNKKIKILTTPESFYKVRTAFEQMGIDIRTDGYFLLFDECQKIVKDCGYRKNISLPMDFFFECQDKAMVSATPPSEFADSRFENFDILVIHPDFNYKKNDNGLYHQQCTGENTAVVTTTGRATSFLFRKFHGHYPCYDGTTWIKGSISGVLFCRQCG